MKYIQVIRDVPYFVNLENQPFDFTTTITLIRKTTLWRFKQTLLNSIYFKRTISELEIAAWKEVWDKRQYYVPRSNYRWRGTSSVTQRRMRLV